MRTIAAFPLSRAAVAAALALAGLQAHAACSLPDVRIHQVQGNGAQSPMQGKTVAVQGVVSSLLYGKDGPVGFFIQEAPQNQDADPATSEGIYVYTGKLALPALKAGDVVGVRGKVLEFGRKGDTRTETQLQPAAAGDVQACGYQGELAPVALRLPLSGDAAQLESLAGMAVKFEQPLYVIDSYNYGRYGELTLSSQPRQWVPTQRYRPGSAEAQALRAANPRDRVLLDDGKTWQNADAWLPAPEACRQPIRCGWGIDWMASPAWCRSATALIACSRCPAAGIGCQCALGGACAQGGPPAVASFNVLNFFNGDGLGGGFPTERGAKTRDDFLRQKAKIVSAIRQLDADVLGLMELENDGFGPQSAVKELVDALNAGQAADKQYRFVDPGLRRSAPTPSPPACSTARRG
ncbi:Uncharacterized protein conserved in bacteria [Chromobacterium violaceum]|uniref:Uncharacterized protein conserved in bacteria n=1 Tax=Chromobacterium violaceum TaxID=536 RepID=A0A3S4IB39_CHRVL|nr:Uncharacterized protein conserved in bacteria [Chromobacterium violaceum]